MSEPSGSGRASRRLRDDSRMSFAGTRRENYRSLQRDASRGDGTAHGTGDANRGLASPTLVRQSTNTPSARSGIDILGQRFNRMQLQEFKLARQRSLGQAVDPAAFQDSHVLTPEIRLRPITDHKIKTGLVCSAVSSHPPP